MTNAARVNVTGSNNPNWRGGKIAKTCLICSGSFSVRPGRRDARYCSMKCVGISQRKAAPQWTMTPLRCEECGAPFSVPKSHAHKHRCCSATCRDRQHAKRMSGRGNANWRGGLSPHPYPWNFRQISKRIIERDGGKCQNPSCAGTDERLTAHHINYMKQDCRDENLLALCSACNSKANFDRDRWRAFYQTIIAQKYGGGWKEEEF